MAIERDDRHVHARVQIAHREGFVIRSNAMVVAQVWRDQSGRQARLARLLQGVDVRAVDQRLGRAAGVLLGRAGMSDAIDATLVLVSEDGDRIMTSDVEDIGRLAAHANRRVIVIGC